MASSLQGIRSIEDFDLKDQRVFLRLDLNVPIKNGVIKDTTRIDASLPTIRYALERGAKLVVASHLGRPTADDKKKYSLEPVGDKLHELLGVEVILVEEPNSEAPKALLRGLKPNQILLLENLRFDDDETENGEELSESIAEYTDIYINDAFGASHRAHASIVGVPKLVKKKGVGFLMKKELEMLDRLLNRPERPFVLVLGGAKVSDKIGVIENMVDKVDTIIVGGAMAYTFLAAQNIGVGSSRVEREKLNYVRELMTRMEVRQKRLLLPFDHKAVPSIDRASELQVTAGPVVPEGLMAVDIGPKTIDAFVAALENAKTVFWNGPMGIFETEAYAQGTFAVAKCLAETSAFTVVGGGDSAAAMTASGYSDKVSHISTGGGASLEYLQGDKLPGVEALRGS